jgi:hypothetical protein
MMIRLLGALIGFLLCVAIGICLLCHASLVVFLVVALLVIMGVSTIGIVGYGLARAASTGEG